VGNPQTPGRITQATAARLMYAADRWATARGYSVRCMNGPRDEYRLACAATDVAKRKFEELVATLTETE
jgi:hypothetical protein